MEQWQRLNNRGFSLVEIMVTAALVGILSLALVAAIEYGFLGAKNIDNRQSISSEASEMRQMLWTESICTGNFKTKIAAPNKEISVNQLDYFDKNGVLQPSMRIFDKNNQNKMPGIEILRFALVPKSRITDTIYAAQVEIDFHIKSKTAGPDTLTRTFPVALTIDPSNQQIVRCGSMDENTGAEEQVCAISSGGRDYYDPITKTCKSKMQGQCFMGTTGSDTATCGYGYTVATDNQNCAQGTDVFNKLPRNYRNGATQQAAPPPYLFIKSNNTSGTCNWAADLDPTGWTCGVRCERMAGGN
jgi:prepilin-type N-terminal cleavage/methylation domain-containing protein